MSPVLQTGRAMLPLGRKTLVFVAQGVLETMKCRSLRPASGATPDMLVFISSLRTVMSLVQFETRQRQAHRSPRRRYPTVGRCASGNPWISNALSRTSATWSTLSAGLPRSRGTARPPASGPPASAHCSTISMPIPRTPVRWFAQYVAGLFGACMSPWENLPQYPYQSSQKAFPRSSTLSVGLSASQTCRYKPDEHNSATSFVLLTPYHPTRRTTSCASAAGSSVAF